jgi:hypothetical protein
MTVMDKLIRLLKDDYKVGAELQSGKPIVYIDPKKIDQWRLDIDSKRKNWDGVAAQMAEQLDAQYPGLSQKLTQKELIELVKDSLKLGPFALKFDHDQVSNGLICIINEPQRNEISIDQIYNTFGISSTFNPSHLRPLAGRNSEWAQFVGEHEGEHCNQDPIYSNDPEAEVKTLGGEVLSDRAALENLRKEGKHEMVAQIIAIRALAAANGGHTHATSIFLSDPEFTGVTREHLDAAKKFKDEMCIGVAANLGITPDEAEELRLKDPQKFARAVDEEMKKGEIPALREMDDEKLKSVIAQKMGITLEELEKADVKKINEVYQKLKADGQTLDRGQPNPHVNKYIQSYLDATKVLFVADTTPAPTPEVAPEIPAAIIAKPPEVPTAEEAAAKLKLDLEIEAATEANQIMEDIVAKTLGITSDEAKELSSNDPNKYHQTVKDALDKGMVSLQTTTLLPEDKIQEITAKRLSIPIEELAKQPAFLVAITFNQLLAEGALTTKRDNPYLKKEIEDIVKGNINSQDSSSPKIEMNSDTTPATSAKVTSKYSYLMVSPQDDGKGKPQINLHSEDRGQMKIGTMTAGEYFATKADPELATLNPSVGIEIKNSELTTKIAQNASYYRPVDSLQA